ncbi:nucleotidyltransferase domain-containing protein [Aquiflexum gelatinilyticum]|jgi:predicted nucleotidyltransferase|uniref:Nucleotidyltransferase domain-containing protein n=1 Tax=Aquiflexum gelatinilyticum TaxID=2961943 RepID=A0A9X2PAD3_9BACT|nr:nucleotidyltransferase domain-containing protein [Aquiflexum gelatinilyticum]MCR9016740.1 nucleotidyltransferase domain-containing protein [Aquiflexum gelatinilyticum]
MEKFGLNKTTIHSINSVFESHPNIERSLIYGSRAKGNFRTGSDIDLTLFGEKLTLSELLKIENELDDLMLPYKIDISIFHKIESRNLTDHIQRIGKEFYSLTQPVDKR